MNMNEDEAQDILEAVYPPGASKLWEAGRFFMLVVDRMRSDLARLQEQSKADREAREAMAVKMADMVPRSRYDVACEQYNECEKQRKILWDRCRELEKA
jgi:hypothetical protein